MIDALPVTDTPTGTALALGVTTTVECATSTICHKALLSKERVVFHRLSTPQMGVAIIWYVLEKPTFIVTTNGTDYHLIPSYG